MNEHRSEVERAAEALRPFMLAYSLTGVREAASALSAAGLLRTDVDKLNEELADAMVAYARENLVAKATGKMDDMCHMKLAVNGPERARVLAALRAILDARKPKERWTVARQSMGGWTVECEGSFVHWMPDEMEPEARAYVARKNAEGAK